MAGQQAAEQLQPPFLQSFRQQGVVGVGEGAAGDLPGGVPVEVFVIDQQPHQFGHGDRGMGVVELHGPVVRELLHRDAPLIETAQHVLQAAADKEVLLLEPQAPAFIGAVVGIEHFGDRFRVDLFFHRPVVIADVEGVEVEGFGRIGAPEPQPITGVHPKAQHGHIMGNADGVFIGNPTHPMVLLVIEIGFGAAAKANKNSLIGLGNFPGPAGFEPLISDLYLAAIANQLVEDAEFVADAVARGGNLQGSEGFQVAGCQSP